MLLCNARTVLVKFVFAAIAALGIWSSPAAAACEGPYAIRSVTKSYIDTARANRSVGVTVHFPVASSTSTAIVPGCAFPVIAFGHGFTIGNSAYGFLTQRMVPKGYVIVMPSTEGGLAPNHGRFGDDLAFAIRAVRADVAFSAAVGTRSAIGGHSMGGGAAFLGAARNPSITALFAFAPAETNPSAIAAANSIPKPSMVVTGSRDCVTPYAKHAGPMITNLIANPTTPDSSIFSVPLTGASHCQFTTGSGTCGFGESTCGGRATISAAQQHTQTMDALAPWLDLVLKN